MRARSALGTRDVLFSFADRTLDVERRELRHGSEPVAVEPQVFDLLIYLIQNRDRVVSKDDLIASVWGGRIVSESTLTSRINAARKAVGDSGDEQHLIRTVARKGIRFVGEVRASADASPTAVMPAEASTPREAAHADPSDLAAARDDRADIVTPPCHRASIAVMPFVDASTITGVRAGRPTPLPMTSSPGSPSCGPCLSSRRAPSLRCTSAASPRKKPAGCSTLITSPAGPCGAQASA